MSAPTLPQLVAWSGTLQQIVDQLAGDPYALPGFCVNANELEALSVLADACSAAAATAVAESNEASA